MDSKKTLDNLVKVTSNGREGLGIIVGRMIISSTSVVSHWPADVNRTGFRIGVQRFISDQKVDLLLMTADPGHMILTAGATALGYADDEEDVNARLLFLEGADLDVESVMPAQIIQSTQRGSVAGYYYPQDGSRHECEVNLSKGHYQFTTEIHKAINFSESAGAPVFSKDHKLIGIITNVLMNESHNMAVGSRIDLSLSRFLAEKIGPFADLVI